MTDNDFACLRQSYLVTFLYILVCQQNCFKSSLLVFLNIIFHRMVHVVLIT